MSSWLVRVRVYECPAVIAELTLVHPLEETQVLASTVFVVPDVLSFSVAVAQS